MKQTEDSRVGGMLRRQGGNLPLGGVGGRPGWKGEIMVATSPEQLIWFAFWEIC